MAGSWNHMTTKNRKLLNNENFCGMVENLGDAYEAAEECFGMIWWLADQLQRATEQEHGSMADPSRSQVLGVIAQAEAHYRDGLELGGVQRER